MESKKIEAKIKVVEFKATLTKEQKDLFAKYQELSRRLRNHFIYRLKQFDEFTYFYKKTKDKDDVETMSGYAPCCPIRWNYRMIKENGEDIRVPYTNLVNNYHGFKQLPQVKMVVPKTEKKASDIVFFDSPTEEEYIKNGKTTKEWLIDAQIKGYSVCVTTSNLLKASGYKVEDGGNYWSCPVNYYQESPLKASPTSYQYALYELTTEKYLDTQSPYIQEIKELPSAYRNTLASNVGVSWKEYDKSRKKMSAHGLKRGCPRSNKPHELPTCLANSKISKKSIRIDADSIAPVAKFGTIKLSGNPHLRLKNLTKDIAEICVISLIKKGENFFCQVTARLERSRKIRPVTSNSVRVVGCDPGVINFLTLDDGKVFSQPYSISVFEEKIAKEQQKIAHKLTTKLLLWLNDKNRKPEDISSLIPIKESVIADLLSCKTEQVGLILIGASRWQRLKRMLPNSNQLQRSQTRLTRLHDKLRRQRRSFQHRLSTWFVRNYDVMICEDGLQDEKMRHRSNIKLDENGVALPNNQSAKAGLTKSLSGQSHGQFMELCEHKFNEAGKLFIRSDARFTTKQCPVCDSKEDIPPNYPGQKILCQNCGYLQYRDQRPGILMIIKAVEKGQVDISVCSDDVKLAYDKRLKKDYLNRTRTKLKVADNKDLLIEATESKPLQGTQLSLFSLIA